MKNKGKVYNNRKYKVKHGMAQTRPYKIWSNMKSRCLNKNKSSYDLYGGRGIKVCKKWMNFEGFWEDMCEGYEEGLEIDRINNKGNYEKSNCRWTTHLKNCNNRSNCRYLVYKNKTYSLTELRKMFKLKRGVLETRLKNGWDLKKAVETPVKLYKPRNRFKNKKEKK